MTTHVQDIRQYIAKTVSRAICIAQEVVDGPPVPEQGFVRTEFECRVLPGSDAKRNSLLEELAGIQSEIFRIEVFVTGGDQVHEQDESAKVSRWVVRVDTRRHEQKRARLEQAVCIL